MPYEMKCSKVPDKQRLTSPSKSAIPLSCLPHRTISIASMIKEIAYLEEQLQRSAIHVLKSVHIEDICFSL